MKINTLRPKSAIGRWFWLGLWGPISLLGAFLPLVGLNLLQFPSLLVLPFSRPLYRAYNEYIAALVWGWWAYSIQYIVGLDVKVSGDPLPNEEDAIVFCNHQTMTDVPVLLCLAMAHGRIGNCKWMVKDSVKYLPGIGWGMVFLGCIFLKRNWSQDEAHIKATFKTYVEEHRPLWVLAFPEGTRITPAKLTQSQAYAKGAGLKPTNYVLLPRPKGFAAAVEGLRSTTKAVYSITIAYPENCIPTLPAAIRGDLAAVEVFVQRYPVEALSRDERTLSAWLMERFYEKDARLGKNASGA